MSTFHRIQGVWRPVGAATSNWFALTGNQSAIFCFDTDTSIGATRTRFSLLNELDGLNDELDNLGILSPNRVVPFQMSFSDFDTDSQIGRISGFWVDDDGSITNQRLVITERVVQQSARGNLIPSIGVHCRNLQ